MERALAEALARGMDGVRLLGRLSPANARAERVRLTLLLERGEIGLPRWQPSTSLALPVAPARDFDQLAELAERSDSAGTLGRLYAERARELGLEARLAGCIGTAKFGDLARLRFAARAAAVAQGAEELARSWLAEDADDEDEGVGAGATVRSDEARGGSLLSALRAEVAARPELAGTYRVEVNPELASLAATGEREIHVAPGRELRAIDVVRTVRHEIDAHALPRVRARRQPVALFAIGTAGGTDDQEGRAILLEERLGHLDSSRRRVLARRHLGCLAMIAGADFAEVCRLLVRDLGAAASEAVLTAERVFRGSDGTHAGLGRERVYLEAYVEAAATFTDHPELEAVVAAGQVSFRAAPILAGYLDEA